MRRPSSLLIKHSYCILFILIGLLVQPATGNAQAYDVVIAGAGTGGVSAAIQAARMGAQVALLEESDWIGGQMAAAAVSTMDEANHLTPPSGLYGEFLARMQAYYRARHKQVGTCYWQQETHCFEPSAIRKVLNEMVAETNAGDTGPRKRGHITIMLEERVARVVAHSNTVTGVVTAGGKTLTSKVLIDATEYGDVLPLTPARYRSGHAIGRAPQGSCVQDITYTMVIKAYPGGVPKELQMQRTPPGYEQYLPALRSQWKLDGNEKTRKLPVSFAIHNAYRGLPDSSNAESYVGTEPRQITRTVLNWFNDYPADTTIFDRTARKEFLCAARLKTLANLYYLQHELGESSWSVADDEGYDTEFNRKNLCPNIPQEFKAIERNFPVIPYIRESNRLVGEYTLTGGDIRREKQGALALTGFPDSIAVGDYPDDLHGCHAEKDMETDLEHLSDSSPDFRFGPFEIPMRSLIPETVDGLLAAEKNISQSRLANGATRLQPITMLTGQAAGALAALSVEQGSQPRTVAADRVQIALLEAGSILARKPMPDLPVGTRPWQAAQFAVAHQWIDTRSNGFAPADVMTRGQVADLLSRAFSLLPFTSIDDHSAAIYAASRNEKASYRDVPLYADISAVVEAWNATGTLPACKRDAAAFCPEDSLSTGEFMTVVSALRSKSAARHADGAELRRNVMAHDGEPLTRGDAAIILYNNKD